MPNSSAKAANASLKKSLGIFNTPGANRVRIGVDSKGNTLYADRAKLEETSPQKGADYVESYKALLEPFGIFDGDDKNWLETVKEVAQDASFIGTLTQAASNRDAKQFVDTLLGKYGTTAIKRITDDPEQQSALNASLNGYFLYKNWNNMSEGQKAIGIANVGLQAHKAFTGDNLAKKVVPGSENYFDGKGVTVGQALQLTKLGFNGYSLAKNWGQLDTLQKLSYGTGTIAEAAALGESLGLLGKGPSGALVAEVTPERLASIGASPAPAYGVGAVTVAADGTVPAGYTAVATNADGTTVAVPQGLEQTSAVPAVLQGAGAAASVANTAANYSQMSNEERALAVSQSAAQTGQAANAAGLIGGSGTLATAAGVGSMAAGAYMVYKGWGQGGKEGGLQGAMGGAALAAGLYTLGASNPYLLAGVVAFSVASGTMKKGKDDQQVKRDAIRRSLKDSGFIGSDYTIELADGTKANVGLDGNAAPRAYTKAEKRASGDDREQLNLYDVDYTNDLDFFAGMGGIALSRILTGGNATETKQIGGQFGNASLGKVGHGADLTPENFDLVMQNQRSMYAKAGIANKEDAYQLANSMYAEGRINESDLVGMHQAFNMVFDGDFNTANTLAAGRFKGLELAAQGGEERAPKTQPEMVLKPTGQPVSAEDRDAAIARNREKYGQYQEVAA